jgi:aquaporin Z
VVAAEFIGTFTLVLAGAGAAAAGGTLTDVALAHGLAIVAAAYAFGPISGAHLNPAVTLGVLLAGAMQPAGAITHWVTQLLAGIVAAATLFWLLGTDSGLGATLLSPGISPTQGVVLEAILTFLLVTVVLGAAVRGRAGAFAGIAIAATLMAAILMGGPLTGASMNPARSLGPALFLGGPAVSQLWIYFLGPLAGGAIAAVVYKMLFAGEPDE